MTKEEYAKHKPELIRMFTKEGYSAEVVEKVINELIEDPQTNPIVVEEKPRPEEAVKRFLEGIGV